MERLHSKIVKIRIGKIRKKVELTYYVNNDGAYGPTGRRIQINGGYWPALNAEIKQMRGHKWHGFDEIERKVWSVEDCLRNEFQLLFLMEENPYAPYDTELPEVTSERPLYEHQLEMLSHVLERRQCILACEMGTGKTLVFIEAMERVGVKHHEAWYVGPKAGVNAVKRELRKWKSEVMPRMFTYEGMRKEVENWTPGVPAPRFICFDESSKLKTPTAKRSKAALHLADSMRREYGRDAYIILMSGTPAPKSPLDWWHQCEVACPGFLKEGDQNKFRKRLALTEQRESIITGGSYGHLLTWLDDDSKCGECGKSEDDHIFGMSDHPWKKSVNEVDMLYRRMQGLVTIKFKTDCTDLPDKRYEVIRCKPTVEMVRAAKLIKARSARAIQAITLMRELSDGFQYTEKPSGWDVCPNCKGNKEVEVYSPKEAPDLLAPLNTDPDNFEVRILPCDNCGATGQVARYSREAAAIGSPKDQVYLDELDLHDDVGRYIVWGGFTGTLDRLVEMSHQAGWATLRIDGRGQLAQNPDRTPLDLTKAMDAMDRSHDNFEPLKEEIPKLVVIGHPQAAGMAYTFTGSPTELFYSNSNSGEARMQAEDRAHRLGMDANKGLTIKDIIMFGVDQVVLDNLRQKKKLQNLTMGQLRDGFTAPLEEREV